MRKSRGKAMGSEWLSVLLAGAELPGLHLARSDRRQSHLAAVSRAIELRTLTPLEAWRAVGVAKRVG